jgi:alpha-galactosidase
MGVILPDRSCLGRRLGPADFWVAEHFSKDHPPFSFTYGGIPGLQVLSGRKDEPMPFPARCGGPTREYTSVWTDPKTGLEVRMVGVQFFDTQAVEWTVYFKNAGNSDTPILENIRAIDEQFAGGGGPAHLHYIDGDGESRGNLQFAPQDKTLVGGVEMKFAPLEGRPTDGSFPYYNLSWDDQGVIAVLGWPGQWSASFVELEDGYVYMVGGQANTRLVLHPGEEIRTPRVVLLFYQGGWLDGQNEWRHWMRAHNMPHPGGAEPPVLRAGGGFMYDKLGWGGDLQNEKDQFALIDGFQREKIKLNVWWIDILGAGTFTKYSDKYITTPGDCVVSWDTDLKRFPNGLKAMSEHAGALGEKLCVWIEPEQIWGPNVVAVQHPDWLLQAPDDPAIKSKINQGLPLGERKVINMGNPAACDWLIDTLSKLIAKEGIGIYRQDFNITPLLFWQHADAPDRQGMTENLYVQGYLRLLDTLQARFPKMLIDTCASGGRRDDLETLRRAVPLWRSDQYGPDVVQQTQSYGLALWVPYFGTGTHVTDPYSYRSSLGSSLMTSWDVRDPKLDYGALRKLEAEFWQAAPFFREDYYPLIDFNADATKWLAWQYNRPEKGDGMVQAFRRDKADERTKTFPLQHLDAAARYQVTELDGAAAYEASGKDLMEKGIVVEIKEKPGAVVIIYRKK